MPVGEVALALGGLLGKVFGILEGFGAFAGWQTAALKAHSHCCGPGPGVPVGEAV